VEIFIWITGEGTAVLCISMGSGHISASFWLFSAFFLAWGHSHPFSSCSHFHPDPKATDLYHKAAIWVFSHSKQCNQTEAGRKN
jgi:hypothetical protein